VQAQPEKFMARVGIVSSPGRVAFAATLEEGIALARAHLSRSS
jgi:hypothetical protein